ncbi:MAG: FMN-dependent NADH-azoreductase [Planctomycetota bacterium]|jgi:FMN-dependent NADH-azoreductase
MKTLAVTYLPRGERSRTRRLFDCFAANCPEKDFEHLDLTVEVPDFFLVDNLNAYYRQNYAGEEISAEEADLLKKMAEMTEKVKQCDVLVMAFPMHNFSLPAIVKAFFDSIMLKGETWNIGEAGYEGLMGGKKALVLYSSGGVYESETSSFNCLDSLALVELGFMGFGPVQILSAQGMNMFPEKQDEIIEKTNTEIIKLINEWY